MNSTELFICDHTIATSFRVKCVEIAAFRASIPKRMVSSNELEVATISDSAISALEVKVCLYSS